MNAIVSCMSWVPICWRDLLGLFYKNNNGADDPVVDLVVVDKPFSDSGEAVNSLDNLDKPDDYAYELPVTGNPLPTFDESLRDPLIEHDPLHALVVVHKPPSKPKVDLPDLPNSIVEDILSRLPPNCIFQCQRHSKALHALTKTSYFAQMQRNWSNSVTVVHRIPDSDCDNNFIELYFIDEESHNIETKTTDIRSSYKSKDNPISIVGSYDGFLIFTNLYPSALEEPAYYLWNPITDEKITWGLANEHIKYVCGFYFCPLRREYALLLVYGGPGYHVQILNMRTKVREDIGKCSYPPSRGRQPVIINRTLYWMVDWILYNCIYNDWPSHSDFIVSFDMETERFTAVGHSGCVGKSSFNNKLLHLIALEGELCLCHLISWKELELSVLNHKTKCWVKTHTVILPEYGIMRPNGYNWTNRNDTEVVHYEKGELLVRHLSRLYSYNLHSRFCRNVEMGFADHDFQAIVHVDSLVSFADE